MKLTTLFIVVFLTAVSNIAFALDAPEPFEPNGGEVFDKNTAATFSWNKVSGATKYQFVFGTDESFSSFDEKKNKCTNTKTCATVTVNKISYKLAKTNAFMKKDGSYFWKIRSYKGTTKSAFSDVHQFQVGEPTEQKDAKAQYDLGDMYYDGKGVTQNYAEAFKHYKLAAE